MLKSGILLGERYLIGEVLVRRERRTFYRASLAENPSQDVLLMEFSLADQSELDFVLRQHLKEAERLKELKHPRLLRVGEVFNQGDLVYAEMPYVRGKTLEACLFNVPERLPVSLLLQWVRHICEVLEYLHEHEPPIILRELGPANVLIDTQAQAWVLDTRVLGILDPSLIPPGLQSRAAGYVAVESYGKSLTDARTDIYSLGALIYTMLTRTIPPPSVDLLSGEASLQPPSALNRGVRPALEEVLRRMLALTRSDRYETVAEARQALEAALTEEARQALDDCEEPEEPGAQPGNTETEEMQRALPELKLKNDLKLRTRADVKVRPRPEPTLPREPAASEPPMDWIEVAPAAPAPMRLVSAEEELEPTVEMHMSEEQGQTQEPVSAPAAPAEPAAEGARYESTIVPPVVSPQDSNVIHLRTLPTTKMAPPPDKHRGAWVGLIVVLLGVVVLALTWNASHPPGGPAAPASTTMASSAPPSTPAATVSMSHVAAASSAPASAAPTTAPAAPASSTAAAASAPQPTLQVAAQPEGASIKVDGVDKGTSPLKLSDIPPGHHSVEVAKAGYKSATVEVNVAAGQVSMVDPSLEPLSAVLELHDAPAGSQISVDSQDPQPVPEDGKVTVPQGEHLVRVSHEGNEPFIVSVNVGWEKPYPLQVRLGAGVGRLDVTSKPSDARVRMDGRIVGRTPLQLGKMPAGEHHLTVEKDGFKTGEQAVKIESGQTATIAVELKAGHDPGVIPHADAGSGGHRSGYSPPRPAWHSSGGSHHGGGGHHPRPAPTVF